MHRQRRLLLLAGCVMAGIVGVAPGDAETITYSYDALGRLRASSVSGGPDSGNNTAICYDAASNRERYVTTKAGAAACTPSAYPQSAPQRAISPASAPATIPAGGK